MVSEVSLQNDVNAPLGFQLTGGAKFAMPLTVFEVEEGGRAFQAGIRLGDILVKINGRSADELSLEEAYEIISQAGNNVTLAISNLDDQDYEDTELSEEAKHLISESLASAPMATAQYQYDDDEEHYVDVRSLPLKPPRPAPQQEKAQRKAWHPVMLDTSPPPVVEDTTGDVEFPHKKMMRNLKRAIDAKKVTPTPEKRLKRDVNNNVICETDDSESPMSADPSVAEQLRSMQKQLKNLALLPAAIQATLAAVSDRIESILPDPYEEQVDETTEFEADDTDAEDLSVESGEVLEEEQIASADLLSEDDTSSSQEVMASNKSESESSTASSSPEPELTQGAKEKLLKKEKVASLNRSWPWADDSKPVYKIADHYQSVYSRSINNQVQWLEKNHPLNISKNISTEQIRAKKAKGI